MANVLKQIPFRRPSLSQKKSDAPTSQRTMRGRERCKYASTRVNLRGWKERRGPATKLYLNGCGTS
jgi:hypothetical protein